MVRATDTNIIDLAEYRRLRNQEQNAELIAAFENAVIAQVMTQPLRVLRDMAKLHDALRDIMEANRLPMPYLMSIDASLAVRPNMDTITVPMQDYKRLRALELAIGRAEEKVYG